LTLKGRLRDGSLVAVKVLSIEVESMRGEREFMAEIAALSDIKHENLVTLRGCCVEGADRYLVYDYMENNSLAHSLLGNPLICFIFLYLYIMHDVLGVVTKLYHT
jgi:serine/threonine protein kinase